MTDRQKKAIEWLEKKRKREAEWDSQPWWVKYGPFILFNILLQLFFYLERTYLI